MRIAQFFIQMMLIAYAIQSILIGSLGHKEKMLYGPLSTFQCVCVVCLWFMNLNLGFWAKSTHQWIQKLQLDILMLPMGLGIKTMFACTCVLSMHFKLTFLFTIKIFLL